MPGSAGWERVGLAGRSRTYANQIRSLEPEIPRACEIWLLRLDSNQRSSPYEGAALGLCATEQKMVWWVKMVPREVLAPSSPRFQRGA